ncbi:MAG: GtrA family protein [Gammaproteobacteria bacterium]|nr:GtrA family protein [Gammaproteobacteria bacterium]
MKASAAPSYAIIRRFIRFALVGASGTLIQYITLWAGVGVLRASPVVASAIGYVFGSISNYGLNYVFTFRSTKSHMAAAPRYFTVLGIGWCLNTGSMAMLVNAIRIDYWLAQIVTTGFGLIWNFLGSHLWAFRESTGLDQEGLG